MTDELTPLDTTNEPLLVNNRNRNATVMMRCTAVNRGGWWRGKRDFRKEKKRQDKLEAVFVCVWVEVLASGQLIGENCEY